MSSQESKPAVPQRSVAGSSSLQAAQPAMTVPADDDSIYGNMTRTGKPLAMKPKPKPKPRPKSSAAKSTSMETGTSDAGAGQPNQGSYAGAKAGDPNTDAPPLPLRTATSSGANADPTRDFSDHVYGNVTAEMQQAGTAEEQEAGNSQPNQVSTSSSADLPPRIAPPLDSQPAPTDDAVPDDIYSNVDAIAQVKGSKAGQGDLPPRVAPPLSDARPGNAEDSIPDDIYSNADVLQQEKKPEKAGVGVSDAPSLKPRTAAASGGPSASQPPSTEAEYMNVPTGEKTQAQENAVKGESISTSDEEAERKEDEEITAELKTFHQDLTSIVKGGPDSQSRRNTLAGKVARHLHQEMKAGTSGSQTTDQMQGAGRGARGKQTSVRFGLFRKSKNKSASAAAPVVDPKATAAAPVTIATVPESERVALMGRVRAGEITVKQMDEELEKLALKYQPQQQAQASQQGQAQPTGSETLSRGGSKKGGSGGGLKKQDSISPKELKAMLKMVRRGKMTEDDLALLIAQTLTPTGLPLGDEQHEKQPSIPDNAPEPDTESNFYGKADVDPNDLPAPAVPPSSVAPSPVDPSPPGPAPAPLPVDTEPYPTDDIYDCAYDGPADPSPKPKKAASIRVRQPAPPVNTAPAPSHVAPGSATDELIYGDAMDERPGAEEQRRESNIYSSVADEFANLPQPTSSRPPSLAPRARPPDPAPYRPGEEPAAGAEDDDDGELYSALPPADQAMSSALESLASTALQSATMPAGTQTGRGAVRAMMQEIGLGHLANDLINAGYDDVVFVAESDPADLACAGIADSSVQQAIVSVARRKMEE